MQTPCLVNRSDTATFEKARLVGCNGDSGARNREKPSPGPSNRLIPSPKRIALVAHDNRKKQLASWALKHRTRLIEHELYATSHTADIIADALSAPVFHLLSGPLGGDQQIGSRIAESKIDVLIFFWDPLGHQPHRPDFGRHEAGLRRRRGGQRHAAPPRSAHPQGAAPAETAAR